MPRAGDHTVPHLTLGERPAGVGAGVLHRVNPPAFAIHEHRVAGQVHPPRRPLGQLSRGQHRGPLARTGQPGVVVDHQPPGEDQFPTQVCGRGAHAQAGHRERFRGSAASLYTSCERGDLQAEAAHVDQPVQEPEAPLAAIGHGPVRETRDGGRHRGGRTGAREHARREVLAGNVEDRGSHPQTDWSVGQDRVQRVSEPAAVQEVLDPVGTGRRQQRLQPAHERLGGAFQPAGFFEDAQQAAGPAVLHRGEALGVQGPRFQHSYYHVKCQPDESPAAWGDRGRGRHGPKNR